MQLRECIDLYIKDAADISPRTIQRIGYEVTRWERITLNPPIDKIGVETFSQFRADCIAKGLAARSIESNIDTVRLLMRAAVNAGRLTLVPVVGRRLRRPRPRPRPLTPDELRLLFVHADIATWPNHTFAPMQWWRAFFVLTYWTGFRLEDACWKLDWRHIDLKFSPALRFEAGKTEHIHEIPLPEQMIPHLARVSTAGLVLGPPRSMKCFRRELNAITRAARIGRPVTAKHMRQTAVSQWSKASSDAGRVIHGCGLGDVRDHYVDPYDILLSAAPRVPWPFPDHVNDRQLRLF